MTNLQTEKPDGGVQPSAASKRKLSNTSSSTVQFTSRNPPWTYLKLQLIPQPDFSSSQPLDALSARTYLSSALSQFLGLTGTAISIDILKIEHGSDNPRSASSTSKSSKSSRQNDTAWIRVPREDAAAVVGALSSWIGGSGSGGGANVAWRVCAKSNYLGTMVGGSGKDLFVP